jgi:hypothetical protein
MKTKRGLRLLSFLLAVCVLVSGGFPHINASAASGTVVTISAEGQVVDTFNGVSSVYRPGSSDGSDATYGCHAYIMKYYQAIYGKYVYNLFHKCTPMTYGDSFVVVTNPQPGDICAQVKTSNNHWSIVKSVSGSTVTVIDQNNKWVVNGVTSAYKNFTYNTSEVTFYRLASLVNGGATTAEVTTTEAVTTAATTTQAATTETAVLSSTSLMTVTKGSKKKITAKYVPVLATTSDITWKSSKKKVAKVSKLGYVTGVKKGSATITGTLSDGQKVKLPVQVKAKAKGTLTLVSSDVTLPQNSSWTITATKNTTGGTLSYSSSNPSIATVNAKGCIKTFATRGMTTITVTSSTGKKKKCIVRVY